MALKWEKPPETAFHVGSGAKPGRYVRDAAALREHLGEWALLESPQARTVKSAKALAQNIRSGKVKGFERGTFETAVDGTKLWVRCTDAGEEGEEEDAPPRRRSAPTPSLLGTASSNAIRQWARNNGFNLGEKGRLPDNVVNAYYLAHPQERPGPRAIGSP